jgi:REP element-mobilizing transposase RayT
VVTIRSRGRLPHWEADGATYFVTFRLFDSLPKLAVWRIEFERDNIIRTAAAAQRKLSKTELRRLQNLFARKLQRVLDSGAGACFLANQRVAAIMADTIRKFHGVRYECFAWCVMPNHVHAVIRPFTDYRLPEILHSWKSFTATAANRILRRSGRFWQREYFDHLLRDERQFHRAMKYVLDNPKKAALHNWPWVGANP